MPEPIRALHQDDEETADEALHKLCSTLHHQGTVYPASAPAVPFLAHAVLHVPGRRDHLLMLLAGLADHDPADIESPYWPGSPVAEIWRDREPEVLDLLLAALPHQRNTRALASCLHAIGHRVKYLPEPSTELRDALHRYASADDETAEPALLALMRFRDPRDL